MTRKEAREAIKEAYGSSEYTDEIIKALEKEPCGKDINVPATDCISRQAVKELFQEACEMKMYDFLGIDDIPSVTPQQKIGHWILAGNQSKEDVLNDNYRFICSECKCSDIHAKGTKVPYCWRCGSKMEVEE